MSSATPPRTLATVASERGEFVLRRRDDGALELRVNGVVVMDTAQTSTESALAHAALDLERPHRVLVGGLGLGFTTAELLRDPRVRSVVVAEIEPAVLAWMTDGTVPGGVQVMSDDRVRVQLADVRDVVTDQAPGSMDAILLDVDNGPDFLVLDANAGLYREAFVRTCLARLRPGGVVVIWSSTQSPDLESALAHAAGSYTKRCHQVDLAGRLETYSIYSVTGADL